MLNKKNKSKRRRSLRRRRNVKSRKVMRGGGFVDTDIGVVKTGKANLYKTNPIEFGTDGFPILSTHDIKYKIIEILDNNTVAHIQVIKIDDKYDITDYYTYIRYPSGTTTESCQLDGNRTTSLSFKLEHNKRYVLHEIL